MASRTFTDYRQAGSSLGSSSSGDESDSEIAETLSRRGSNEAFDDESEGYSSGSDSIEAVVDRMGNMHVWTREELEQKTVAALKEVMKERNLPTGGNKTDLINRLLGLEPENETDLSKCAVARLRAMLKARNLPTGGKKEELIRRIEGTEHVEEGTYAYFDRYTNKELVEKLKAQERDAGGTKKDLINRLLGNEPSMPPEGWANSKDREMLFEALRKVEQSSLRFKTAEEAYSIQPYNRWPWYRFKGYFKDALVSVLKEETIARQDNRDFENLLKTNPRPKWTSRGEPYWSNHVAKDLLERDLLDAMEHDPPSFLTPKELWDTRAEYREFKLTTFQSHVAQQLRRFRQFPGWQKKRNEDAHERYREEVENERSAQFHESNAASFMEEEED